MPRQAQARRRGYGLLLAGLALWMLVGMAGQWQAQRQSAVRATAVAAEAAYADLLRDRHVITAVRVTDSRAEALRLSLTVAGRRGGAYRLSWRLDETLYGVTLESGERRFDLGPEAATLDLAFDPARLAQRYRATVLEGRPDKVLVDGSFRLRLSLEPELEEDERRALPDREIGNLERGLSDLRFETSVDLPMTLDLTGP